MENHTRSIIPTVYQTMCFDHAYRNSLLKVKSTLNENQHCKAMKIKRYLAHPTADSLNGVISMSLFDLRNATHNYLSTLLKLLRISSLWRVLTSAKKCTQERNAAHVLESFPTSFPNIECSSIMQHLPTA